MDLSIIIVNYNTKELLKNTINSVINTLNRSYNELYNINYEIIVSDNDSTDGSQAMVKDNFPQVKLIENNANLGFSKANNIAIKQALGRYVLLLNSDTEVMDECLEKCIIFMDKHPYIGALGCKLILPDSSLDHACKRGFPTPEASLYYMLKLHKLFPKNKVFNSYTLGNLPEDEINEVDSLTGAFMMVKRDVIDKIGLMDEKFFMYGEDLDWCYRIKEAGYKVIYYPEVTTIHYKGGSSKKKRIKIIYEFHRAMYLFYNKHYIKEYNVFITALVYIGIFLKLIVSYIINIFKR